MAAKAAKNAGPERKQRLRVPRCLPTPPSGEQPFAKRREELKNLSEAEIVLLVMQTPAWKAAMKPVLDAVDRERLASRRDGRGGRPAYTAEDIEKALLFQRVCGYRTYSKAHMRLTADSRAREILGFTRPNAKKATRYVDGVPSKATVSRHLKRFGKERRGDAWDTLAREQRDYHVAHFPEMQEEMRVADLDGTAIKTHYTTPMIDPKTKKVTNAKSVTCPDGGYVPPSAGPDKSGNGWNLIPISTHSGVPFAWSLPKLNSSEKIEATKLVLDELMTRVRPLMVEPEIGVITADGGFASPRLREALRGAGYIENIHNVSHKRDNPRAESERNLRIPIKGYPNWFSDGHRQLVCSCGDRTTFSRIARLSDGSVTARVEGSCKKCGSITITSGKWRRVQNPDRWVRVDPSNPDDVAEADWLFGNPLTFDDPLSKEFGSRRFGHCEGFYGTLWKRFRLNTHKRWFRSVHDARAEVGMVFTIIHVLSMEQRTRKAAATGTPPPGSA